MAQLASLDEKLADVEKDAYLGWNASMAIIRLVSALGTRRGADAIRTCRAKAFDSWVERSDSGNMTELIPTNGRRRRVSNSQSERSNHTVCTVQSPLRCARGRFALRFVPVRLIGPPLCLSTVLYVAVTHSWNTAVLPVCLIWRQRHVRERGGPHLGLSPRSHSRYSNSFASIEGSQAFE